MTYIDLLLEKGCEYNKELKYNIYANTDTAKSILILGYVLDTLENLNPEKCFDQECVFLFTEFNKLIDTESDTDKYFKEYCKYLLTEYNESIFTEDEKSKLLLEFYHKYHLQLETYYSEYKNVIDNILRCVAKLLGNCTLKLK